MPPLTRPETAYIKYSVATNLMARSVCESNASSRIPPEYNDAYRQIDRQLTRAVELGDLQVFDPLTHAKHPYPIGAALHEAVIPIETLRVFALRNGLCHQCPF